MLCSLENFLLSISVTSFCVCCCFFLVVLGVDRVNSQSNFELHKHTHSINDRKKVSNFAQAHFIESLFK